MDIDTPTWSIVATVEEPPALVQAFVAWHLHLGAEVIYLYLDNPDDPVACQFRHLPQVDVVRCDSDHWARVGKSRPRRHEIRQVRNAQDAFARTPSDWLVHIDADEFLWPHTSVADILRGIDPAADGIVVQVAERIHRPGDLGAHIFEGAFRRPFRKPAKMGQRIFGPDFAMTQHGLTGHAQGKAFSRVGRPLDLSIHRPKARDKSADLNLARPAPDTLELLHFDGLTPLSWVYKHARMIRALEKTDGMPPSPHRRAQAEALVADVDAGEALYARLKVANDGLRQTLSDFGLLVAPDLDVAGILPLFFPKTAVDLSPEAFDLWLRSHKPHITAYLSKSHMKKGPPAGSP